MANPAYGDIWFADLDPTVGHEQAGERPVLVLSIDTFNQGASDLTVILPLTTRLRPVRMHVPLFPPEGGVTRPSAILCENIRCISHDRLERRMGTVSAATMQAVQDRLRILLNL